MAAVVVYAGLVGLTAVGFTQVPTGFVPTQDKEYLVAFAQLPDGASLDRTEAVIRKMTDIALKHPGVANSVAFPGLSINGFVNAPNAGIVFVVLKPFEERTTPELTAQGIVQALNGQFFGGIQEAFVAIFPPPPVQGLGTGGRLQALRRGSRRRRVRGALRAACRARSAQARAVPSLAGLFSSFQVNVPQIDARRRSRAGQDPRRGADRRLRDAAGLSRLALRQRLQPLRTHLPGERAGRVGLPPAAGDRFARLETRNAAGEMVPLGSLVKVDAAATDPIR